VVILPTIYRRFPLAWASLAHEACGHGVLQADPGLLPDLVAGIRSLFGGGPLAPGRTPDEAQTLGLLWSYWIEETASDVYGLLNIGPAFALNLAAFIAAKRQADSSPTDTSFPTLPAGSGNDPSVAFDEHPPDLLRLHVAMGVIQNLTSLSPTRAAEYVRHLGWIADACRPFADQVETAGKAATPRRARTIALRGRVEVDHDRWVSIDLPSFPLDLALESARRVGAFIATIRLGALGNSSIQEIETWDDADEHTAHVIRDILLDPKRAAVFKGEDAKNPALDGFTRAAGGSFSDPKLNAVIQALDDDENIEGIDRLFPADAATVVRALQLNVIETEGDDAQLLAGATLAAFQAPSAESFRWINRRLAFALNRSHHYDPIMGQTDLHRMYESPPDSRSDLSSLPPREQLKDPLEEARKTGAAVKPGRPETPVPAPPAPSSEP
jgi:hypothetical protein